MSQKRNELKTTQKKGPISTDKLIELCNMFKDSNDLLIIRDLTMMLLSLINLSNTEQHAQAVQVKHFVHVKL
jgi:hypothetical protein